MIRKKNEEKEDSEDSEDDNRPTHEKWGIARLVRFQFVRGQKRHRTLTQSLGQKIFGMKISGVALSYLTIKMTKASGRVSRRNPSPRKENMRKLVKDPGVSHPNERGWMYIPFFEHHSGSTNSFADRSSEEADDRTMSGVGIEVFLDSLF